MKALLLVFFLFSVSISAQTQDIFEQYLTKVESGDITSSNAFNHLDELEGKLYRDANKFFDELAIVGDEVNYIAPKDKLSEVTKKWEDHFRKKNLEGLFKKAIDDPGSILKSPEAIKAFKDNRKFSHIMRSTFYVFDEDHSAPKKLEKYVKPFGKLNDAVVAGDHEAIRKYAKKVLEARSDVRPKKIIEQFKTINKAQLAEHFSEVRKNVTSMLGKSVFTPHEYHYIRKQFKEFLVVYSNLDAYMPHPKLAVLDGYITKLGELNDIYTDLKFRFGLDIDKHQIEFPQRFKYEIGQSLGFLEEDMLSVRLGKSCQSFFRPATP